MCLKQLQSIPITVSPHAELAVYRVHRRPDAITPVYDGGGGSGEQEGVFVQVPQFTASLPEARQFNLTIIRSARQIGFTASGETLDFYYNRHHLETIIVNV